MSKSAAKQNKPNKQQQNRGQSHYLDPVPIPKAASPLTNRAGSMGKRTIWNFQLSPRTLAIKALFTCLLNPPHSLLVKQGTGMGTAISTAPQVPMPQTHCHKRQSFKICWQITSPDHSNSAVVEDIFLYRHVGSKFIPMATIVRK